VAQCGKSGRTFGDLSLADYQQFSDAFADDVFDVLQISTALAARKGIGAPSPENVKRRLAHWRQKLSGS
jgi:argininosuccinate lyase